MGKEGTPRAGGVEHGIKPLDELLAISAAASRKATTRGSWKPQSKA